MSFLSPLSLLLIVPIGGIIVLLYLLKLKRREHMVSSVMLWQDAVADIQANAPFQKLKTNLLLLLQIIVLALLALSIARPFIRVKGASENKIVLILDSSASMQSKDASPTRFEGAKAKAQEVVNRMGPGDTMLVMTAGAKAKVTASFTSDKRALTGAIRSLKPSDTSCNMRQALVLALSLVAGKSQAKPRIVILSDGGFDPMPDLSAGSAQIDFVRMGSRCDNVAITGLSSRKTPSGDAEVFVGLRNFSDKPRTIQLGIYAGERLIDVREETLKPGASRSEILGDELSGFSGRLTAKIEVDDDLEVDNSGSVYLTRPKRSSVLLVTKGNIFLQNALNLDPNTQVARAGSVPADLGERGYDVVVFDGVAPPSDLPPGGYALIGVTSPDGPAEAGEEIPHPSVVDWSRKHPVSAYVDFSDLRIQSSRELTPKPWATSIVEGAGGPLGVAGTNRGRHFVQLSWDLMQSDFPLRVGFPIFIANCLDWLAPDESKAGGESARTGSSVMIDTPPSTSEIAVTDPDGRVHKLQVTQTPFAFDGTDRAGVYKVKGAGVSSEFACNLASAQESDTRPRNDFRIGGKQFTSSARMVSTNQEFYAPLLILALAVLTFEWYAYHRRI